MEEFEKNSEEEEPNDVANKLREEEGKARTMSDSQVYEQGPEAAAAKPNTLSRSQSEMGQVCTNCRCLFGVKMTGSFCDDVVSCVTYAYA